MKTFFKLLTISFLFICVACKNNECEGIDCFTPPNFFHFELINKASGKNLFSEGVYKKEDVTVINSATQETIEFRFIAEGTTNLIEINTIGWKTEKVNYTVLLKSKVIFKLYVDAKRLDGGCCDYTEYNEIKITDADFKEKGSITQILIPVE